MMPKNKQPDVIYNGSYQWAAQALAANPALFDPRATNRIITALLAECEHQYLFQAYTQQQLRTKQSLAAALFHQILQNLIDALASIWSDKDYVITEKLEPAWYSLITVLNDIAIVDQDVANITAILNNAHNLEIPKPPSQQTAFISYLGDQIADRIDNGSNDPKKLNKINKALTTLFTETKAEQNDKNIDLATFQANQTLILKANHLTEVLQHLIQCCHSNKAQLSKPLNIVFELFDLDAKTFNNSTPYLNNIKEQLEKLLEKLGQAQKAPNTQSIHKIIARVHTLSFVIEYRKKHKQLDSLERRKHKKLSPVEQKQKEKLLQAHFYKALNYKNNSMQKLVRARAKYRQAMQKAYNQHLSDQTKIHEQNKKLLATEAVNTVIATQLKSRDDTIQKQVDRISELERSEQHFRMLYVATRKKDLKLINKIEKFTLHTAEKNQQFAESYAIFEKQTEALQLLEKNLETLRAQTKHEKVRLENEINTLKEENEAYQHTANVVSEKAKNATHRTGLLQADLLNLQKKHNQLLKTANQLSEANDTLEQKNQRQQRQMTQLRNDQLKAVTQHTTKIIALEKQLHEMTNKLNKTQQLKTQLQKQLESLKEEHEQLATISELDKQKLEKMAPKLRLQHNKIESLTTTLSKHNKRIKIADANKQEATTLLLRKNGTIHQLNQDLILTKSKHQQALSHQQDAEQALKKSKTTITDLSKRNKELESLLEHSGHALDQIKTTLANAIAERNTLLKMLKVNKVVKPIPRRTRSASRHAEGVKPQDLTKKFEDAKRIDLGTMKSPEVSPKGKKTKRRARANATNQHNRELLQRLAQEATRKSKTNKNWHPSNQRRLGQNTLNHKKGQAKPLANLDYKNQQKQKTLTTL